MGPVVALTASTRPPERIVVVRLGGPALGGPAIPAQRIPAQWVPAADGPTQPSPDPDVPSLPARDVPGLPAGDVLSLPAGTSFGVAVAAGIRHGGLGGAPDTFYWLIHDGVLPRPDALERLLTYARVDPGAAVLGPKVLDAARPEFLLEAGVTVDRAGRRITGVVPGVPDHGQHDAVRDVLAVSCTGMLVRASAWERLGGLAADMTAGLDLDLGARAARAGLRVVVVPPAAVLLAPPARTDAPLADRPLASGASRAGDRVGRVAGARVRLALTAAPFLVPAVLALVVAGAARAGARLLLPPRDSGDPSGPRSRGRWRDALTELWIAGAVLASPRPLFRMRVRFGRCVAVPRRAVRELLSARPRAVADRAPSGPRAVAPPRALAVVMALFLGAAGLAVRRLPPDAVGGGVPMPEYAGDLWSMVWSGWQGSVGGVLGWPGSAPPWTALLAALSSVAAPVGLSVAATCSIVLAVAPAAATYLAYRASGRLVGSRGPRLGLAALYGVSPPVTGSVLAGRIETAVALAVLPAVLAAGDEFLRGRTVRAGASGSGSGTGLDADADADAGGRGRAGWRFAVSLALVVACAPVLAPITLVGLPTAAWAVRRSRPPGTQPPPVGPVPVLGVLIAGAVPLLPGLVTGGVGWWPAAVSSLSGSELTGLVAGAPGDEGQAAVLCLFVALCLFAALCLLLTAYPRLLGRRASSGVGGVATGWAPATARVGAVLLGGCVLAFAAGLATATPIPGPAQEESPARAVAALSRTGGPGARVLVLRRSGPSGPVAYSLAAQGGPRFPAAAPHRPPSAADRALATLVADISAGPPDAADALPAFGVAAVVVPAGSADPALVAALDAVDGLSRERRGPDVLLWRPVAAAPGAGEGTTPLRLGSPGPAGPTRLPGGAAGRRVVLAEPADSGWRATLDGAPLPAAVADGWAQAFVLPAEGGLLEVSYDHHRHRAAVLATAAAGALLLAAGPLAAVPRRRRGRRAVATRAETT
ncbi:glycosyltransferase [Parafrankia sp. BMG5.11]|uniref:glycosyltransferase n=2 Tax=unclassified Parafrankia TaxID=2994368 RepID=UPI001FB23A66|nr:glycosyltransferase [Parafrankia sp. BMG5.11]